MHCYHVYILSNHKNISLYIGVTNDLQRRMYEHKNELYPGFTKKYKLKKLVYYEEYQYINDARKRERQLKNWRREWKENLIRKENPDFRALSAEWFNAED